MGKILATMGQRMAYNKCTEMTKCKILQTKKNMYKTINEKQKVYSAQKRANLLFLVVKSIKESIHFFNNILPKHTSTESLVSILNMVVYLQCRICLSYKELYTTYYKNNHNYRDMFEIFGHLWFENNICFVQTSNIPIYVLW